MKTDTVVKIMLKYTELVHKLRSILYNNMKISKKKV